MDFIVQRPESHSIHCATGVHAFNYSDLPLFNIFLATVRILKEFATEKGFYLGDSSCVGEQMLFKAINDKELT